MSADKRDALKGAGLFMAFLLSVILCSALYGCAEQEPPKTEDPVDLQSFEVSDIPLSKGADSAPKGAIDASNLQKTLEEIEASYSGNIAIVCVACDDSWRAAVHGSRAQTSASMIKLAIMGAFLEKVNAGEYSLDDTITLSPNDIVGGTGVLQASGAGSVWTYEELVTHMIANSDNVATNVIIDTIGSEPINEFALREGLEGTKLNRRMMDFSTNEENYTSADDVASLLLEIFQGSFINEEMSKFALEALENQSDNTGLIQGMSGEHVFAHKTGTLSGVENDGGIVLSDAPYLMVVLTEGMEESSAQSCMIDVAESTSAWLSDRL